MHASCARRARRAAQGTRTSRGSSTSAPCATAPVHGDGATSRAATSPTVLAQRGRAPGRARRSTTCSRRARRSPRRTRSGIVHRDLKPANLFLTRRADGAPLVKVLDFGISKVADADGERALTQTGVDARHRPLYMSPEQIALARRRRRAHRHLVARRDPLRAARPARAVPSAELHRDLRLDRDDEPRPLTMFRPDAPAALIAIVMKALAKEPASGSRTSGRSPPPSHRSVQRALGEGRADAPTSAPPPVATPTCSKTRPLPRRPRSCAPRATPALATPLGRGRPRCHRRRGAGRGPDPPRPPAGRGFGTPPTRGSPPRRRPPSRRPSPRRARARPPPRARRSSSPPRCRARSRRPPRRRSPTAIAAGASHRRPTAGLATAARRSRSPPLAPRRQTTRSTCEGSRSR